jgi:hypothetical protein
MFLVVVVIQICDEVFIIVIWPTGPGRVEYGVSLLTGDNVLCLASERQANHGAMFSRAYFTVCSPL